MKARHTFVQMLKTKDQGKILELLEEKAIAYRGTKAADLSIEVLCIRRPRSDIIKKKKKHKESNQVKSLFNKTTFKQWKQNKDPPPHTHKWTNERTQEQQSGTAVVKDVCGEGFLFFSQEISTWEHRREKIQMLDKRQIHFPFTFQIPNVFLCYSCFYLSRAHVCAHVRVYICTHMSVSPQMCHIEAIFAGVSSLLPLWRTWWSNCQVRLGGNASTCSVISVAIKYLFEKLESNWQFQVKY